SPVAVVKATGELLEFIGYPNFKDSVDAALDALEKSGLVPNGGKNGVTCDQATEFLVKRISEK
ncbi:MAG: hypothetical protein HQK62_10225, partial [Desulfamplus sp.]|nr:hypothetical protein [Desulfamplus sp.]